MHTCMSVDKIKVTHDGGIAVVYRLVRQGISRGFILDRSRSIYSQTYNDTFS